MSIATIENESVLNRYYDPATDQFLSVDPDVMETGQPYAFTGDDPLNLTDPLGLEGGAEFDSAENGGGGGYQDPEQFEHGGASSIQKANQASVLREEGQKEEASRGIDRRELLKNGEAPSKNNLVKVGRSYQEHMDRGELPKVSGTELNNAGRNLLREILTNPDSYFIPVDTGRFAGGFRIIIPGGSGATFGEDGTFGYFGIHK